LKVLVIAPKISWDSMRAVPSPLVGKMPKAEWGSLFLSTDVRRQEAMPFYSVDPFGSEDRNTKNTRKNLK